ncbi:unnamed protein product [Adineta steineri]|uniref:Copper transport protein n=2 Tax=Adineta steineri TaxID=433720 RepID=A0A820G8V8_9BILA|nr:unnamed protein product [Adineta steineri]CAF4274140.1 unnamed protein product [Adineta steineri]
MKMDMDMSMCMVMQNGFQVANGKDGCILFLFQGWNVDTHVKYAFMLIGVICMGLLNGALAYVRHCLVNNSKHTSSLFIHQIYLSLLYAIQIILAYWMMLLVMTYETGIFISLICGLVLGHFVFGYIEAKNRSSTNIHPETTNTTFQNQFNSTPCCQTNA